MKLSSPRQETDPIWQSLHPSASSRIVVREQAPMLDMCVLIILLWLLVLVSLSLQSVGSLKKVLSTTEVLGKSRGYGYGYSPVATYPVV